jgi:hypothetical protein
MCKSFKKDRAMKIYAALLAGLVLASTAGLASAQNTMSPANQARPGQQGDDSSKPNGLQNNAGTRLPARTQQDTGGTANSSSMSGTTGAAPNSRSSDTNVSPSSGRAGEQQPAK